MKNYTLLIISFLLFCYFSFLIVISYTHFYNTFLNAIAEIITLPMILITVILFILSLTKCIQKNKKFITPLIINSITLILMIAFSIIQS